MIRFVRNSFIQALALSRLPQHGHEEAGNRTLRRKLPILPAHVALACLSDPSRCLSQPSLVPGNLQPRRARSAATCCKESCTRMRRSSVAHLQFSIRQRRSQIFCRLPSRVTKNMSFPSTTGESFTGCSSSAATASRSTGQPGVNLCQVGVRIRQVSNSSR